MDPDDSPDAADIFGTIGPTRKRQEVHVLARWQFWVTTTLALLVALVAGYTMMLFGQNRATQAELAQRAQYVQQSVQLEGLYRELVKALADLSVRNADKALADLLNSQGITLNTSAPAPAPAPAVVPDARKGGKP